jgi:hypothetical protein
MTDILEQLRDQSLQLARRSFDSVDAGLAANVADAAIDEIERLRQALQAAQGRIMNAKIYLQTGHTKAAGIRTLDGIIKFVDDALSAFTEGTKPCS